MNVCAAALIESSYVTSAGKHILGYDRNIRLDRRWGTGKRKDLMKLAIQFPNLEKSMLDSGFDKQTAETALAWLDSSKERDLALLQKLTIQKIKNEPKIIQDFDTAFKKDVVSHGSDELYRRVILMCYQLLDADASDLIRLLFLEIPGMKIESFTKLIDDAMQEVWGNEAQTRALALHYGVLSHRKGFHNANLPTEPVPYLEAAELTSDKCPFIKLMLCANALEYMPLPEGETLSEEAQRAVSIIRHLMQSNIEKDHIHLLTALAPASCFDAQLKSHFMQYAAKKAIGICNHISLFLKSPERALDALFAVDGTFTQDILFEILRRRDCQELILQSAANMQTELFKAMMLQQHVDEMAKMYNALKAVKPDEVMDDEDFRDLAMERTAGTVAAFYPEQDKIKAFLHGDIAFDEVYPIVKSTKLDYHSPAQSNYIEHFGEDDFITRCIVVLGGSVGTYSYHLDEIAGFGRHYITDIADRMLGVGLTIMQALDICGNMMDQYSPIPSDQERYIDSFSGHTDEIAAADITKCNATAKIIALTLFKNDENKYRPHILALAGDSAKAVSESIAEIAVRHPEWSDDIQNLLQSKKSSARDLALTIIERQGAKAYIPALKDALSAEKTDKLKARIGSMLAVVSGEDNTGETASAGDIVKEMTKGKKAARLDWLFQKPFTPVHKTDGTEADESWLKALMLCFANSVGLKDPSADVIAAALVPEDVCRLANEALERWLTTPPEVKSEWVEFFQRDGFAYANTLNAQAKYKWVLYFASVYGGKQAMDLLDELMAHWPLMQKGGLAKEIPHAILLNGSSEYIMKVEKMSRKHRFNSIRKASADALLCASEKLGISKEEFADLMVPDLDFDEQMCRIFDYGSRQFKVYISPKLEPEIYCDDKKLKSMPKPAAGDDKSKADAAYKEFTAMKKLMKTVVTAQRVRLENTMRTGRTWTSQNWNKLFVANPIMHRFAIGLIWGIYQDDKLETSFRYLDDGSFTTANDEAFTLPEHAQIGLVHPVELSDEALAAWKQQLKDYEILQPFVQLDRNVFKPTDEEQSGDCIERFKGQTIKSTELAGAMNKIGWSKGTAGDGAMIDDFLREDIFTRNSGIRAVLTHSGMSVEVFRSAEVDVTIDKLYFYRLPAGERMTVKELRDRYFSEILYQLSMVFTCD